MNGSNKTPLVLSILALLLAGLMLIASLVILSKTDSSTDNSNQNPVDREAPSTKDDTQDANFFDPETGLSKPVDLKGIEDFIAKRKAGGVFYLGDIEGYQTHLKTSAGVAVYIAYIAEGEDTPTMIVPTEYLGAAPASVRSNPERVFGKTLRTFDKDRFKLYVMEKFPGPQPPQFYLEQDYPAETEYLLAATDDFASLSPLALTPDMQSKGFTVQMLLDNLELLEPDGGLPEQELESAAEHSHCDRSQS